MWGGKFILWNSVRYSIYEWKSLSNIDATSLGHGCGFGRLRFGTYRTSWVRTLHSSPSLCSCCGTFYFTCIPMYKHSNISLFSLTRYLLDFPTFESLSFLWAYKILILDVKFNYFWANLIWKTRIEHACTCTASHCASKSMVELW